MDDIKFNLNDYFITQICKRCKRCKACGEIVKDNEDKMKKHLEDCPNQGKEELDMAGFMSP